MRSKYYLDKTTVLAPEDSIGINLSVRPGMADLLAGKIALQAAHQHGLLLIESDQQIASMILAMMGYYAMDSVK